MLRLVLASVLIACFFTSTTLVASAQAVAAATGTLAGVVTDEAHKPMGGVEIRVAGPVARTAVSADDGSFAFNAVPEGVYSVNASRAGFTPIGDNVTVIAGQTTNATLHLAPASFSSLQTIGRVSASGGARSTFNTSTAAITTISGSALTDQGELGVDHALNELPGVTIGISTGFTGDGNANGASPLVTGIPTVRGALPYETESLIDGHPMSIGEYGTFNPSFISPYILQDVEVAKGPGAQATNINYAIGGTINFRTLEPTATPQQSFDVGVDQYGGQTANFRATGTLPDGKFAYALDWATFGTQGPNRGWNVLNPIVNLGQGAIVNGQVACGNPNATGCSLGCDSNQHAVLEFGVLHDAVSGVLL